MMDDLRRLLPGWPVLCSAAAAPVLVGMLSLALHPDGIPPFLAQLVVLILVTGPAYLLDESAAPVTAVVPTSLLRRRLVLLIRGLPVTVLSWAAVRVLLDWRSPSLPLDAMTWEVAGLSCLGVAAAVVVSRCGEHEPGNLVTSVLGLGFVGVLICQPMFHGTLLVMESDGPVHPVWWAGIILASVTTLVVASHEGAARWPSRRG